MKYSETRIFECEAIVWIFTLGLTFSNSILQRFKTFPPNSVGTTSAVECLFLVWAHYFQKGTEPGGFPMISKLDISVRVEQMLMEIKLGDFSFFHEVDR